MTAMPVHRPRASGRKPLSRMDEPFAGAMWPADLGSAEMISCQGRESRIIYEGSMHSARIAFGCLVQPEPGDRVLVGCVDDTMWIVSVLERRCDAPPRLWSEGDLQIETARGDVRVTAGRTVTIDARASILATALEIDLHARMARFILDELVQIGRRASWYVSRLRSMGEVVETFAEHVLMRTKRASRFVEESDRLRAGDIDHSAEATLQLQANVAFVTADTIVRVDADQIHMG
ncbi:MAG TPA: DUF3540 domain-containing protein [Acetobacteraceae bacterium]|nr:DUF3540 domain-containing protein [Acetobacteraceae bacterium]